MGTRQLNLCSLRDELEMLDCYVCSGKGPFSSRFNHHRYFIELSRAIVSGKGEVENLIDGGTAE